MKRVKKNVWLTQKEFDAKNWEKKLGKPVKKQPAQIKVMKEGKLVWNF